MHSTVTSSPRHLVIDVTAPTSMGGPTSMYIRATDQTQSGSTIASISNEAVMDLATDPSALDGLVALGATIPGEHQIGGGRHRWTVMQDPEGNELCSPGGCPTPVRR